MNKSLYKIVGIVLIIAGIISALISLRFELLYSIIIFVLSFFPGRVYIKISDKEFQHNKLTNSSLVLTLIGMIIAFSTTIITVLFVGPGLIIPSYHWRDVGGLIIFPVILIFLAAFLYAIAVILLLINKFNK